MAKLPSSISKLINPLSTDHRLKIGRSMRYQTSRITSQIQVSKNRESKVGRASRPLIAISTSGGKWQQQWSCEYMFTLRQLHLADLAEEGYKDSMAIVKLSIQEHSSFGLSIVGRILTSFNRKCSCCFSSYCKEIDTTFDVWVLPTSKNSEYELPEIGGTDPSVIYIKPGSEAVLDSIVQDTLRLTTSAKDTCSQSCEKPTIIWQSSDKKNEYDRRWYRLLEMRDSM
ncbi:large ribosomal RNA subunit accumulation protein YCED homolog 2, chloroplastic isoform X1 [Curcuma longa]|uniref:large ribosomal RNA subunit accumulation protein YCED homolog 2, chloroplastic isoform X1 n=1 Tax=Curcuma longa TaxID=136217 RepID=UPI003D9EE6AE